MEFPAYAKLNLTLEVLGHRPDGYHEVSTILQTIDLADHLEVQPCHILRVECDDPTLNGEANLAWRAAVALAKHCNLRPQASIFIRKHIPVGMGMGGGSSDAAATLLALNHLWRLGMAREDLSQIAAGLGSDVPFFLWGGTALAEGRGDQVRPLPLLPSVPVTLVCPQVTIPHKTAQLYSHLGPEHYTDGTTTQRMEEALTRGGLVDDNLYNVFERVAPTVFPNFSHLRECLENSTSRRAHLSGSGPSLFYMPSGEEEYLRVAEALHSCAVKVYFVHTIAPSHFQAQANS